MKRGFTQDGTRGLKERILAPSMALMLTLGLAACGAEGSDSASAEDKNSTSASSSQSESTSTESTTSIEQTRMPDSGADAKEPEISSADSDSSIENLGRGSETLMGKNQRDSRIYRNSEGWEFLEYPPRVMPGGRFIVETADGSTSYCSFGWWVFNKDNPKRHYMTSAGHCGNKGDRVYIQDKNGKFYEVGKFVWSLNDKSNPEEQLDHALIELTVDPKYVQGTPPLKEAKLAGWASMKWLEENQPRICRLGYRSGLSCGSYRGVAGYYMFMYDNISDHGDSGGAIWAQNPDNPNEIYAVGMTSYGFPYDATSAGAAALAPVMNEFGFTVVD